MSAEVDPYKVIATLRTKLLLMVAALGTVADELHTAEEILRNPSPIAKNDIQAFESSLREAIEAGQMIPDQAEEMLGVLEAMADSALYYTTYARQQREV